MADCTDYRLKTLANWIFGSAFICLLVISAISCRAPHPASRQPSTTDSAPYGPNPVVPWNQVQNAALHVPLPEISDAEYVNDDSLCITCHETYVKAFHQNVHRDTSCEQCHGPASCHLSTRGQEPGTLFNFKQLAPPERSELCLKCHEQNACSPGAEWRTSPHAAHGVSCTDCHTSHYNVPPGTPATSIAQNVQPDNAIRLTSLPSVDEQAAGRYGRGPCRVQAPRRGDATYLLPMPLEHGSADDHGCSALSVWGDGIRLHDLPRPPRQNPSRDASPISASSVTTWVHRQWRGIHRHTLAMEWPVLIATIRTRTHTFSQRLIFTIHTLD